MNLLTTSKANRAIYAKVSEESESAIILRNISVRYRVPHERVSTLKEHAIRWLQRRMQFDDFWALHDLNLQVCRGEVLGIIGRNGAGKSTLLKVISRVLHPTEGHVWIRGRVAPLLEFGAGFHPELTGRENVFLNGALLGFSHAEMKAKFQRIVDFADLWEFIDAPLRTYSSGMLARLGFSVATDVDPDILIIDELLGVGDAEFQKKSSARIRSFRDSGATILLVSHSLDYVQNMCTRAVWLERGRIVADGSADAIAREYRAHALSRDPKRPDEAIVPQTLRRWGSGLIQIEHVRLTDGNGREQSDFETGQPLHLQMDYHAHFAVRSPIFGIAIHRQDGVHVTGPNTSFAGMNIPQVEGKGTITFSIPDLALLEGSYLISVAVTNSDDTEIYDYHDQAYPFRVTNESGRVRERYGIVTLGGEWKHEVSAK